jgi:penicillin amidase
MLDSLITRNLTDVHLEIVQLLRDWNYMADPDMVEPSYYHAWWVKMYELLWDEFEVDYPVTKPSYHMTKTLLNNYPEDSAFDNLKTVEVETMNDIITKSFLMCVDSIRNWRSENSDLRPVWSDFKNTRITHMTRLPAFSYSKLPIGGYRGIVNATAENWGASWRMVVELGDEIKAWGIYPGGQSGNPGSPAYNSFTMDWAQGKYFRIRFWDGYDEEREGVRNIIITKEIEEEN